MSDVLTILDGKAILTLEEGRRFERSENDVVAMFQEETTAPLQGAALPDGTKFPRWKAPFFILVHQTPPQVRLLRWIADDSPKRYGPGTRYRKVRVSLPYAITFAVYYRRGNGLAIGSSNEMYFSNKPVDAETDRLCFPALLNVSRIKTPRRERAWICTQHLRCPSGASWTQQLKALLDHTWNGAFNLSSEDHEGASWFDQGTCEHMNIYPVEKWEANTAANDRFGLTVPWQPVPMTVGELIECIFEEQLASLHTTAGRLTRSRTPASLVGRFTNYVQKDR